VPSHVGCRPCVRPFGDGETEAAAAAEAGDIGAVFEAAEDDRLCFRRDTDACIRYLEVEAYAVSIDGAGLDAN
jgi:hypothetical protein